jgi:hypothetical protein
MKCSQPAFMCSEIGTELVTNLTSCHRGAHSLLPDVHSADASLSLSLSLSISRLTQQQYLGPHSHCIVIFSVVFSPLSRRV